jgi:glycosyltransferase involved in cell wall biosynthesis/SAM-dependent methyltransferase
MSTKTLAGTPVAFQEAPSRSPLPGPRYTETRMSSSERHEGLVSVVMPFFNAGRFIEESIRSVFAQTYDRWELLLIDDGSRDGSTGTALDFAARCPLRVRCLEHAGRQNRGVSASRSLGIDHAQGEYIALLDSDDVWDPDQLKEQVRLLEECPPAAMVYGNSLSWYSWAGDPEAPADWVSALGVGDHALLAPPRLATGFLTGELPSPCPSSVLLRRAAVEQVGGCEDSFRFLYDDWALFFKIGLNSPVLAVSQCWTRYRQHPDSLMARLEPAFAETERLCFLEWLEEYLRRQEITDAGFWQVLRGQLWPYRHPVLHKAQATAQRWANRLAGVRRTLSRAIRGRRTGTLVADPNPILVPGAASEGVTTLSWRASGTDEVEVRVHAPDGQLFSRARPTGSKRTGKWVADGVTFYLQDAGEGGGLTDSGTVAAVTVRTLAPRLRKRERYRPSDNDDAELSPAGTDRSLTGDYELRNQALADWILQASPTCVFEIAGRGAGVASIVEKAVQEYVWGDLAQQSLEAARKLLTKAAIRRIDVLNEYDAIPWGRYDAVVCVSPGDLPNDLEVLAAVAPGTNVFLSCATFKETPRTRVFPDKQSVRDRFAGLIDVARVERVADHFIVRGVRKDRLHTPQELDRIFVSRQDYYIRTQRRMHRYVARQLHGRVLEIGCSDGYLHPYLKCNKHIGIDLSEKAIEQARKHYPGEFFAADWREMACAGPFDSIFLNDVLRDVAGKVGAVRDLERYKPSRLVVREMEEVKFELPFRLRSRKEYYVDGGTAERYRRWVVRVFDLQPGGREFRG